MYSSKPCLYWEMSQVLFSHRSYFFNSLYQCLPTYKLRRWSAGKKKIKKESAIRMLALSLYGSSVTPNFPWICLLHPDLFPFWFSDTSSRLLIMNYTSWLCLQMIEVSWDKTADALISYHRFSTDVFQEVESNHQIFYWLYSYRQPMLALNSWYQV